MKIGSNWIPRSSGAQPDCTGHAGVNSFKTSLAGIDGRAELAPLPSPRAVPARNRCGVSLSVPCGT